MPLKIRQTKVASNTVTASQNITVAGFGTPKAAILITSRGVANGTPVNHAMFTVGVTDGIRDRSFGYICQHGVITSQTAKRGMTDQCIFSLNTAGTVDGEAKFSGWITDGININWGDLPSTGYLLDVILLGGDIQVVASSVLLNTALNATTSVNIGFQPDSLFVFGGGAFSDVNSATAVMSLGFADNYSGILSQGCISYVNTDNLVTTSVKGIISNTQAVIGNGGDSGKYRITSFTSTGFDVICDLAGSVTVAFLAIKYNSKTRHKVSSFFGPDDFGNFDVNNVGFQPQFAFNIFDLRTSFDVQTSGSDAGSMSVSCLTTPTTNNSFTTISTANISGSSVESSQTDASAITIFDQPGNVTAGTLTNFNVSGYSLDMFDISAVINGASLYWTIGQTYEERACDFFIKGHKETIYSSSDLYITFENGSPIKKCNLDGGNLVVFLSGAPYVDDTSSYIQIDNINNRAYWIEDPASTVKLKRIDLDGANYQVLTSGSIGPMKLDVPNNYIFGIDQSPASIKRLDLNGQNESVIYSGVKAIEPNSIDIDRINQKIWWTDLNVFHKEIANINYNGSGVQDVISDFVTYVGIAVDTNDEKVYWGVIDGDGSPTMFRANTDGTNIEAVIPSGFSSLRSLIIDYAFRRVYAIDVGSREIIRVGIDDNVVEILPFGFIDDGSENPTSITIDQRFYKQLFIRGIDDLTDSVDFFIHGSSQIDNLSGILHQKDVLFYHPLDDVTEFTKDFDWINNSGVFVNGLISSGIQHSGTTTISHVFSPNNNDYTDLNGMNSATLLVWSSGFWNNTSSDAIIRVGFGNPASLPRNALVLDAGTIDKGAGIRIRDIFVRQILSVFPTTTGWNLSIVDVRQETGTTWRFRISFSGSDWTDLGTANLGFSSFDFDDRAGIRITKTLGADPKFTIDEVTMWGDTHLFSSEELSILYELYNTSGIALSDYPTQFNLFIRGHNSFNDSCDLFIQGKNIENDSCDLYISGLDVFVENIDLYIAGKDNESNNIDLFCSSQDIKTQFIELFINGYDISNDSIELFIYGSQLITNNLDLFIYGKNSLTSDIELFIHGKEFFSTNIDLFINGHIEETDNIDLFIKAKNNLNHSHPAFINGSIVSTMSIFIFCDFFIHGLDIFSDDTPLFISGDELFFNNIDYCIHGHLLNTKNLDLFIYGIDNFSDSIDFTILGNQEFVSSLDLFINGPELIIDNIDLYIRVKEAIDIDLFIKGISVQVNQSCPILDPTASIQIGDDLIQIYQSRIDALINQLGKNILLEFSPLNSPCPNCYFDPINNRSNGVYKSGGPIEFNRGQKCPYCKSIGFLQQIPTQCIKALIKWNPKDAENYGISVSDNKDIARIKSLLTDGDALIRAKTAILNYDIQDIIKLRARLVKGPNIVGLRESRYIITFWELIDA